MLLQKVLLGIFKKKIKMQLQKFGYIITIMKNEKNDKNYPPKIKCCRSTFFFYLKMPLKKYFYLRSHARG